MSSWSKPSSKKLVSIAGEPENPQQTVDNMTLIAKYQELSKIGLTHEAIVGALTAQFGVTKERVESILTSSSQPEMPQTAVPPTPTPVVTGGVSPTIPQTPPVTIGPKVSGLSELAQKLNKPVPQLQAQLEKIKFDYKVGEDGAMAILKSQYSLTLTRRGEVVELQGRILAMDGPRDVTFDDGRQGRVGSIDWLLKFKGQLVSAEMVLWTDNVDKLSMTDSEGGPLLWWSWAYKFSAAIEGPDKQGTYKLHCLPETTFVPIAREEATAELPSVYELIGPKSGNVHPLSEAKKYINRKAAFSGFVGKHILKGGTTFLGFEISDPSVDVPMVAWTRGRLGSDLAPNIPLGARVIILSFVSQSKDTGEPIINAKAVYLSLIHISEPTRPY